MPPRKHDHATIEGELAAPMVETPVAEAPPAPDVSWLDIATAPRDGTLVELHYTTHIPDKPIYARYRVTRRRIDRGWKPVGFWSDPVSREEIGGEPTGWRLPEGYLYPGMVL